MENPEKRLHEQRRGQRLSIKDRLLRSFGHRRDTEDVQVESSAVGPETSPDFLQPLRAVFDACAQMAHRRVGKTFDDAQASMKKDHPEK